MHCYCLLLHCLLLHCLLHCLLLHCYCLLLHCYCLLFCLLWTTNIVSIFYNIVSPEVLRCPPFCAAGNEPSYRCDGSKTYSSICAVCPAGKEKKTNTVPWCTQCETGFYKPKPGVSVCIACTNAPTGGAYSEWQPGNERKTNECPWYAFQASSLRLIPTDNLYLYEQEVQARLLSERYDMPAMQCHCREI